MCDQPVRTASKPRKVSRGSRCGAWARSRGRACHGWKMPNGRCRVHGGKSTGARTLEGRARLSEKAKAEWRTWREERSLPEDWRWIDSRPQECRTVVG